MNGADLLCDTLLVNGVDVCFANPGTSEMHFVAALDRKPQMRCILGLFEGVVTGAADGYGRMARRPAATLLHTGPGLANGLANLHNARRASAPVVNVVGDHASHHLKFDAPLTSDIESLARPMSNWVHRVSSPADVGDTARLAILAAHTTPGVATMILPADAAWGDASSAVATTIDIPARPLPAAGVIDGVAAAIRRHRGRFGILVGGDAALAEGAEWAGRIAEAYEGRVFAEVLPTRVARGRGCVSPASIPYPVDLAVATLKDIDLLVLVGAVEPVAFFAYPGKPSRLLNAAAVAMPLADRGEDQLGALQALAAQLGGIAGHTTIHRSALEAAEPSGPLTADAVGELLARRLPEQAIVCDEGMTSATRFRALAAWAAPHELLTVAGGSIGLGIPMAVGAATACPDRKVVNLQADGSALYTVQGLWTEARENLDILTLILSNRSYAILWGELHNLGVNEVGRNATRMMSLDNPPLDWVQLARGFGVEAERVDSCEALARLLPAAMRRRGPFLIECVI